MSGLAKPFKEHRCETHLVFQHNIPCVPSGSFFMHVQFDRCSSVVFCACVLATHQKLLSSALFHRSRSLFSCFPHVSRVLVFSLADVATTIPPSFFAKFLAVRASFLALLIPVLRSLWLSCCPVENCLSARTLFQMKTMTLFEVSSKFNEDVEIVERLYENNSCHKQHMCTVP